MSDICVCYHCRPETCATNQTNSQSLLRISNSETCKSDRFTITPIKMVANFYSGSSFHAVRVAIRPLKVQFRPDLLRGDGLLELRQHQALQPRLPEVV